MKIQTLVKFTKTTQESISTTADRLGIYRYKNWVSDGIWLIDSKFEHELTKDYPQQQLTEELSKRFESILTENDNVEKLLPTIVSDRLCISDNGVVYELTSAELKLYVKPERLAIFKNIPKNCEIFITGTGKPVQLRTIPDLKLVGLLMPIVSYFPYEN